MLDGELSLDNMACHLAVLVLVCFAAVVAQQGEGNINPNCFRSLHIYQRPASERIINTRLNEYEYERWLALSRHHIIPYATMRNFYNALHNNNRAAFERLLNEVINVAAVEILGRRLDLSRERAQLPEVAEMVDNHLSRDQVTDIMYAQEIYAWLPFNIYIGPTGDLRRDEARENRFDTTAYVAIGRPLSNRLATVHARIVSFMNTADDNDLNFVLQEMASLVTEYRSPFPFRRNDWVVRNRVNEYIFALRTNTLADHERYRPLRDDEFCHIDSTTPRSDLRKKRDTRPMCLLVTGTEDTCCINTLNYLREMHRSRQFAYDRSGDQIKWVNRSNGDTETNNVDLPQPGVTYSAAGWFLRVVTLGAWHLLF